MPYLSNSASCRGWGEKEDGPVSPFTSNPRAAVRGRKGKKAADGFFANRKKGEKSSSSDFVTQPEAWPLRRTRGKRKGRRRSLFHRIFVRPSKGIKKRREELYCLPRTLPPENKRRGGRERTACAEYHHHRQEEKKKKEERELDQIFYVGGPRFGGGPKRKGRVPATTLIMPLSIRREGKGGRRHLNSRKRSTDEKKKGGRPGSG